MCDAIEINISIIIIIIFIYVQLYVLIIIDLITLSRVTQCKIFNVVRVLK